MESGTGLVTMSEVPPLEVVSTGSSIGFGSMTKSVGQEDVMLIGRERKSPEGDACTSGVLTYMFFISLRLADQSLRRQSNYAISKHLPNTTNPAMNCQDSHRHTGN
jgi:hypothetical protein